METKDYIVTAWNNKTHHDTTYITDNHMDAKNTYTYYKNRPKWYSNVKIEERMWDDD